MSIDLNRIKSVNDLLKKSGLKDKTFNDCDVNSFLSTVWDATDSIWKNISLLEYTNHNLEHSLKIVNYFLELNSINKWSNYEKLLFVTASLIHDIGMQYNVWAQNFNSKSSWPSAPLSHDEVRNQHIDLGSKLIFEQIEGKYKDRYPYQFVIDKEGHKSVLYNAAHIAFAHSGEKYLNKLKTDVSWEAREFEGNTYRPRLLAGTLKLCDELDGNFSRVKEPNKINTWKMNDISKMHWLACIFIESNTIEIKNNKVYIEMLWRVPAKASKKKISQIKDFIAKTRESKIRGEIEFIKRFYSQCKEENGGDFILKPLKDQPIRSHLTINGDLYQIIDKVLSGTMDKEVIEKVEMIKSQPIINRQESIKIDLDHLSLADIGKLKSKLIKWFDENKETQHYELVNRNEHTDTYLNCRSIVYDQELLRGLANLIWRKYKGKKIKSILAVGTSAIPIAVNLANRLRCSVTFTVSRVKTSKDNIGSGDTNLKPIYHPTEVIPTIESGGNLLIIDDIISGGNVAKEILSLLTDEKIYPSNIYHFSVFRLGNRKIKKDKRILDYSYLLHMKNVNYYDSKDSCPLCKQGKPLIVESKMY